MTIFIMNYNWLEWTKKQVQFYESCGHKVIIVDNGSTYPPLLQWYKDCHYTVLTTKGAKLSCQNRFIWEMGLHNMIDDNYYAVTDSDLGVSHIPRDFADVLIADIERNPEIIKSGFSLAVDDLPDNPYANKYRASETQHICGTDTFGFIEKPVDTTFAIYSKERCNNLDKLWKKEGDTAPVGDNAFLDDRYFYRAHRSPAPYMANHMPWYMDVNSLNEEQLHHISGAKYGSLNDFKNIYKKELIELYGMKIS